MDGIERRFTSHDSEGETGRTTRTLLAQDPPPMNGRPKVILPYLTPGPMQEHQEDVQ